MRSSEEDRDTAPVRHAGGRRRRERPEHQARFRPAGIPVHADLSLLLIAAILAWSFWLRFEAAASQAVAVTMSVVATALFLGSVLAHELAHALEARRRGLHVEDITLYLFGGATRIGTEVARPADQFALAAVGPWTSIVLGCAFGLVAYAAGVGALHTVADVAGELGWLNLLLGLFNLLPGAPLDGGRLLDSLVWRVSGDRWRAARVSTRAGQVLGAALAALGVAEVLLLSGGFVGGFWLILIGWFLARAATSERQAAGVRAQLRGRRVREVAMPAARVPAGASVAAAVRACLDVDHGDAAVITGSHGPVGVLTCSSIEHLTSEERQRMAVEEVMVPLASLRSVQQDAPASELLGMVGPRPVVVLDGDAVRSVVTEQQLAAILRWLPRLSRGPDARPEHQPREARVGRGDRPPPRGRLLRGAIAAASAGVVVAAAAVVPMPVTEISPGPTPNVPTLVETGGPVHPVTGALLMTSVRIRFPSTAEAIFSHFRQHHDLLWQRSVIPSGMDPTEYARWQRQVFRDSVQLASAVALRRAGYPVRVEGGGAVVVAVETGGPADGRLVPGDTITGLDGTTVATASDLLAQVSRATPGVPVVLDVRRGDQTMHIAIRPRQPGALAAPRLGIAVQDAAPAITLPFPVHLALSDVGGPSAGLITALSVYAVTTGRNLTRGRIIAGTGTIDARGDVGPVGGVAQKVAGAAREGASLFLVPSTETAAARQAASGTHVRVLGVDSFGQALDRLRARP